MLYPTAVPSFGATNSGPRVGPIVVTELMVAPADPSAEALAIDPNLAADNLEYIEIFNPTAATVDLTSWRLRLGIDYNFDDGTRLAAGGTLLVVPFNTDNAVRLRAFRTQYGLDDTVTIVGGYAGQLSASGDGVQLQRPGTPPADDPTLVPRLLEDEVVYDNLAPWPLDAFAGGMSLSRVSGSAYGNVAASWTAAVPTPGAFGGDVVGDLTNDGRVDAEDVEQLHAAVLAGDPSGDVTGNGTVDQDDMIYLIEDVIGTSIGDVDFDGVFDSHDLVLLFQLNEFEDNVAGNSTYRDGDWNLDGDFTSDDLLFALSRKGYQGRAAEPEVAALPAASVAAALANDVDIASRSAANSTSLRAVSEQSDDTKQRLLELASFDQIFAEYDSQLPSQDDDFDASISKLDGDFLAIKI